MKRRNDHRFKLVDCEIHVIKLEVNLTNFTGLWGGIFSTLPSLVFVIESSVHAGLSFYIGNALCVVVCFNFCYWFVESISYVPFLWPSYSFSFFFSHPSFSSRSSSPPLPPDQMSRILVYGHIAWSFKRLVPNY